MPKEYMECVKSYVERGVSEKTAKARCAAAYFKKHGITVNEAHDKGYAQIPELEGVEVDLDMVSLIMSDLLELEKMAADATATEPKPNTTDAIMNKDSVIIATNFDMLDDFNVVEITSTMVGAKAYTGNGMCVTWTERALKNAQDTWKFTRASANHEKDSNYGRVVASFLDGKLLKMIVKVNDYLKDWILKAKDKIGVSIEAINVRVNKNLEITSATGSGVTFVFPPLTPACTINEGCGINATEIKPEILAVASMTVTGGTDMNVSNVDITNPDGEQMFDYITWTSSDAWSTSPPYELYIPPHNISEDKPAVDSAVDKEDLGGKMAEDEKPKTICAIEHEKIVKAKDAQMEALNKEVEVLKATVAKFEAEKKDTLLKSLADEGVDSAPYKDESNDVIVKVIEAVRAFKKKVEEEEPVDSGASISATETKTNESGTAFTDAVDAAKKEAEEAAKKEEEYVKSLYEEKKNRGF